VPSDPNSGTPTHGAGDRWLAGESIPGVTYAQDDEVEIVAGNQAGRRGRVLLLVALPPEPIYLIALQVGDDTTTGTEIAVRAAQSALRRIE
jgi:hypothetical protein